jgi:hypothetical protein
LASLLTYGHRRNWIIFSHIATISSRFFLLFSGGCRKELAAKTKQGAAYKIAPVMAYAQQVKAAAKAKVVVDKAVASSLLAHQHGKRHLKKRKHGLELFADPPGRTAALAGNVAQFVANSEPLLLQPRLADVTTRYVPPKKQLAKWTKKMRDGPTIALRSSGCVITLLQPKAKRPANSFLNAETNKRDSITFGMTILFDRGVQPMRAWDQASHLCGHGRCVNPDHLVWEAKGDNCSRDVCHKYDKCDACTHNPRCIAQNVEDAIYIANTLAGLQTLKLTK